MSLSSASFAIMMDEGITTTCSGRAPRALMLDVRRRKKYPKCGPACGEPLRRLARRHISRDMRVIV